MTSDRLAVLREVLSLPTAPFAEQAVVEYARAFAVQRGLAFSQDKAGNVLLRYRPPRAGKAPRWVFAAHMDHPGFLATSRKGRTLRAQFRGGVGKEYFRRGARAVFFTPGGPVKAAVVSARKMPRSNWLSVRLQLAAGKDVPPGTVGMWDLPAAAIRGRRVSARACDDLAGVAAVLCAMAEIARRRPRADVTALLTVAEETGLVGALAACMNHTVPRSARLVAIEASAAQAGAELGDGAVIRVGDRARTFDPSLTALLADVARPLSKRRKRLRYCRQLMAGGTCESTAYLVLGYQAAALSIPLGNYHNRGPGRRIAPEQIHLTDFESLVELLTALAGTKRQPADVDADLRRRLLKGLRRLKPYLRSGHSR